MGNQSSVNVENICGQEFVALLIEVELGQQKLWQKTSVAVPQVKD